MMFYPSTINLFFLLLTIHTMHAFSLSDISSYLSWTTEEHAITPEFSDSIIEEISDDFPDYTKEPYTKERVVRAFTRVPGIDPDGILEAQKLLQNDLYNFTHPFNQRPINDMPEFYFYRCFPSKCTKKLDCFYMPNTLVVQPFYNETHKNNLTKDRTDLRSYLGFENPNLIPNLEEFGIDLNLPRVLSLFGNMRIEERRAGVMFETCYQWDRWYLTVRAPLLYMVRNFFLTDSERRLVEAEPIFNDTDPDTDNEEEVDKFSREHLIADRLGIGDIRAITAYQAYSNGLLRWDVGIESTWPIAFSFKKGLYGSHFPKSTFAPNIDLLNLLNLATTDLALAEEEGKKILLAALDRLSRILLETGLGNNGHIGIGFFTYTDLKVAHKLHFKTRAVLEYLLPFFEERYFIKRKDPALFALLNNPTPATCERDLQFIQQQLTETLFPMGFKTLVFPGFIFKLSTALTGTLAHNWHISLGHDIWWQQRESLGKIEAPALDRPLLRKDIATKPGAFQMKLFGLFNYLHESKNCDWSLGLYIDRTFIRSGIGKDFNVSIRFEIAV